MQKGAGAPTFCWVCNRQLKRAPGKGLGLFYFHIVVDRVNGTHRVHGECLRIAKEDGAKLVTPAKEVK